MRIWTWLWADPEPVPVPRVRPRGVLVHRSEILPDAGIPVRADLMDEYPGGNSWKVTPVGLDQKTGWLTIVDVNEAQIATYPPGSWERVTVGKMPPKE